MRLVHIFCIRGILSLARDCQLRASCCVSHLVKWCLCIFISNVELCWCTMSFLFDDLSLGNFCNEPSVSPIYFACLIHYDIVTWLQAKEVWVNDKRLFLERAKVFSNTSANRVPLQTLSHGRLSFACVHSSVPLQCWSVCWISMDGSDTNVSLPHCTPLSYPSVRLRSGSPSPCHK